MSSSLNAAHALCMLLLRLQQLQRHVEIGSGAVAISVQVWFKHVPGVRPANTCHLHVPAHRVASSRRCAGDKSTVRPIIWLLEVAVIKHQQHIVGEGITNVMEAQSKTFAKRLLPRSRFRDSMRTTPRWFGAPWSWMIWRMPGLPECKPNGRHVASSGRQSERRDPASPYTEACLEWGGEPFQILILDVNLLVMCHVAFIGGAILGAGFQGPLLGVEGGFPTCTGQESPCKLRKHHLFGPSPEAKRHRSVPGSQPHVARHRHNALKSLGLTMISIIERASRAKQRQTSRPSFPAWWHGAVLRWVSWRRSVQLALRKVEALRKIQERRAKKAEVAGCREACATWRGTPQWGQVACT